MVVSFCWLKSPVLSTSMVGPVFWPYACQLGANWSIAGGRQERKVSVTGPRLDAAGCAGAAPGPAQARVNSPAPATPPRSIVRRLVIGVLLPRPREVVVARAQPT